MSGWPISVAQNGQASAQHNRSRKFGPGECGPGDPSYIQLANETGGQPFFLNPAEVAKAFPFVRESSGSRDETLLGVMGTCASDSPQQVLVPVASTVRRITSAVTA